MPTAITLLTAAVLLLPSSSSSPSPSPSARECRPGETGVVVDTRSHQMHLCRAGQSDRSFAVALGSGGVGKQKQGDARTPLGRYGLGAPRGSKNFHIFVPVG